MQFRGESVSIQAAADRAGVDVAQIRRWAAIDGLEIQRRGHVETVILDRVMALSASARRRSSGGSRDALRARLADAASVDNPSVSGLQELARDRHPHK
ncbi:MAG TPA: hypothetical protein VE800_00430 [Actinomycetota bacterium]|nr:hypothetical protein [Actinomycetota bacterium]